MWIMNKENFGQLPPDEKPVAEILNSTAEKMKVSQGFQWTLESQLIDAYQNKSQPNKGWFIKIIVPVAWTLVAVIGFVLLNWTIRSLTLSEQNNASASNTEVPFETQVRQGNICKGPLAVAHGFEVFLTNEAKTAFLPVDTKNTIDEVRSFAWLADGERLAVVGNTAGSGNIYITDPTGEETGYLLSASEAGYLRDASWSRNGRQFVLWSSQNITTLYLLSALGHGLVEKQMDVQILGTPRFAPDGRHIVFYGADRTTAGLFLLTQEDLQPILVLPSVEDESGFAFSPDGSLVAYMEYDRDKGEARLSAQKPSKGEYRLLGTLPIPKGAGSTLPEAANLSWSQDGTKLVFEFGGNAQGRAIYLAYADGSGLVKAVESGHAPSISSDGRCLAYIHDNQVFLVDLAGTSVPSTATPVFLAELPAGRGVAGFPLDKLQWRP
jgi:Tol biopolymer transport system component